MTRIYYTLLQSFQKTGHGFVDEPLTVYVGDKLNLNLDVWTCNSPCDIVHGFHHGKDGTEFGYFPFACTAKGIECKDIKNPIEDIKSYIVSHPKDVYYYFGLDVHEDRTLFYVRSWKNIDFEKQFDQLKLLTSNLKNIIKL